jgi:hypothetical protein
VTRINIFLNLCVVYLGKNPSYIESLIPWKFDQSLVLDLCIEYFAFWLFVFGGKKRGNTICHTVYYSHSISASRSVSWDGGGAAAAADDDDVTDDDDDDDDDGHGDDDAIIDERRLD